jgi:hypothetical protein
LIKKILTLGIILLFLGVTVNPAIATVEPDVDITDKSDVDELVVQIQNVVNEIQEKYGHIPTVRGLCNVILNTLDSVGYMIICIFLILLFILVFILYGVSYYLRLEVLRQNLSIIVLIISLTIDDYCSPNNKFISKPSFQSIYTMLETKSNPAYPFDDCPCLQEG